MPSARAVQSQVTPSIKNCSVSYAAPSGYHTVPNRIKTNGSLPRDRGKSPTSETQSYGPHPALDAATAANGATMFVNHKALNSASSEDELCAILGNTSVAKPNFEQGPSSPLMGTTFLTYPHSPRTRIKTVAGHHEKNSEVYENKHALSELEIKKNNMTLTLPEPILPSETMETKDDFYGNGKYMNANYQPPNQVKVM